MSHATTGENPVLEVRDRPGHPVILEFREHHGHDSRPAPTKCKICGSDLSRTSRIAYHLLTSDECRERINAWLEERMGVDFAE